MLEEQQDRPKHKVQDEPAYRAAIGTYNVYHPKSEDERAQDQYGLQQDCCVSHPGRLAGTRSRQRVFLYSVRRMESITAPGCDLGFTYAVSFLKNFD